MSGTLRTFAYEVQALEMRDTIGPEDALRVASNACRLSSEILEVVADLGAFTNARWHRALDDPDREPAGPIRDHIKAHDANLLRAAADRCCTCHTGDAEHEDWCVATGLLMELEPEEAR